MGINSAIGNALSGLHVAGRNAEIVSRNVANATTPGYTQKTLAVSHQVHGQQPGGVRVDGVLRAGDQFLTAARRRDEAAAQNLSTESDGLRRIADLVLGADGGDSLQNRYLAFETGLRALADTPESASVRQGAADAGRALAAKLNVMSTEAQRLRVDADSDIQRQVKTVNQAVRRISQLNKEIQTTYSAGRDASALEDERDRQIDIVNSIIPIKETKPVNGGMMITTEGGSMLMNGATPYTLSFEPSGGLGVDSATVLSGLTHLDRATSDLDALGLDGGSLEAAFKVRDQHAVTFSQQLDAVARDLAERFQSSDFMVGYVDDPTAIGLFTDAGGARFDDASELGFAGRITFNVDLDPQAGGDAALLRTGAYPNAIARDTGAPFYEAVYDAFTAERSLQDVPGNPGAALGVLGQRTAVGMITDWASLLEVAAGAAENESSFRLGSAEALRDQEVAEQAVDTDEEMRQLLLIEKAYAANAQVLQVADQMLEELLSIR